MTILDLDILTWTLSAFLLIALPLMGRADLRALREALDRGDANARTRAYGRTIMLEWGLTLLLAMLWLATGRDPGALGLVPQFGFWEIFFAALVIAVTAGFVWQVRRTTKDAAQLREVRSQLGALEVFVPHTGRELARFSWLSLTAGICEEFIYRGVLMGSVASVLGIWPAILISSAIFGIGHSYQGPAGVLRTGLVGLVLAIVVVLTGSLFVAMAVHAAIDLSQGRMVRAAVDVGPEIDAEALDAA